MEIYNLLKSLIDGPASLDQGQPSLAKGMVIKAQVGEQLSSGETTLKIGTRLIQAVLSQDLEPGLEVKLQVIETTPRLILCLASTDEDQSRLPITRPAKTSEPPSISSAGNPTLIAKVVAGPQDGLVRLRLLSLSADLPPSTKIGGLSSQEALGGREFSARLLDSAEATRLSPGREIKFTIVETWPQLVLKPAGESPAVRSQLIQALSGFLVDPGGCSAAAADLIELTAQTRDLPFEIQERLAALRDILSALSPPAEARETEFLTRLMKNLGLSGSRTILKEEVAKLFNEILRANPQEISAKADLINKLLETGARLYDAVDRLQLLNQETARSDQTLNLVFPLFWLGEQGRGELQLKWFGSNDGRPEQGRPLKINLLLSLSRLGRLKIDLELVDRKIQGTFWTETKETRQKIQQVLNRFVQALEARGFEVAGLSARNFPPGKKPPETLATTLLPPKEGLIDLKI